MRKLFCCTSLLALTLALGACKEPDPNDFQTHITAMEDQGARSAAFTALEALVKAITSAGPEVDNSARVNEFVEKVIPAFEARWDDSPEHRDQILKMLYQVGRPEGAGLWTKALVYDGSDASRKLLLSACDGIAKAKATGTLDAVIAQLDAFIQAPNKDKGPEGGEMRMALVQALGAIRDKKAVGILSKVMEQTRENQPVAVHREAAKSLGLIRDPSAVDALLTVTFRVPDSASTTDIGNRSKLALVSIGDEAVPGVMKMLRGEHEEVNKLAALNGVDLLIVQQTAVGILGAMGAKDAVDELLAFMPRDGCGPKPAAAAPAKGKKAKKVEQEELDPAKVSLRAFVANSLGLIGDERASEPLCSCVNATHNPGDMFPITEALGRIGGPVAQACLIDLVKTGEYDPETVDSSDMAKQIRWEAARFATLVTPDAEIAQVREAIEGNTDPKVKENMAQWQEGIALVESCKADKECYLKALKDTKADWFAREKAAYELVRLAKGDLAVGVEMAKAFKVRNPDARVTMALMVPRLLEGKRCGDCAEAFEAVLSGEKGSMDATMQLPVLTVRQTIAKISD